MLKDEKDEIIKRIDKLGKQIEGVRIAEYIEFIRSPRRMIVINLIAGLARGLGFAIGATVLGGIFLVFFFNLAQSNIPIIAEFVARIIRIVETYL